MNPIYKTGWGQYVDLSKIVSVEKLSTGCCRIFFQLCEKPIEVSKPRNIHYGMWSIAAGGVTEEDVKNEDVLIDRYLETREYQIDALIMAWETFVNER